MYEQPWFNVNDGQPMNTDKISTDTWQRPIGFVAAEGYIEMINFFGYQLEYAE